MARKRGKKTVASSPGINAKAAEKNELQNEKQEDQFTDPDVERQNSAIKGIRDVEIEHVLPNCICFAHITPRGSNKHLFCIFF
ncbi:hypothetical protein M0R45_015743 [Rubus argutus]|uniref:Uncharacterized protein n=1 Tax=Rubus argutus TaxID=59490 RepID=A0AAW1XRI0_RUBAR